MASPMTHEEYRELIDRLAIEMTGETVLNGSADHAAIINERMFDHAQREMRILTRRFDPRIYGTAELIEAARLFAGQNDRTAKIVIEEFDENELRRHPFFKEFSSYSNIEFRQLPSKVAEVVDINCTVMDGMSYRFERDKNQAVAVAAFGDKFAQTLKKFFDTLWGISIPIKVEDRELA